MSRILAILLAVSCALGAYYFVLHKGFVNPYPVVCDLVAQKIFLGDDEIKKMEAHVLATQSSCHSLFSEKINY